MEQSDDHVFTVGDLKRQLQGLKDDHKLTFAGDLTFYRLERWADDEHIVEFNEAEGYLSDSFKKRNPNVKVIFMESAKGDWNEAGTVQLMDVEVR